ncbi:MAG: hypothetical protein PUG00_00575 [Clostridiales bacterium]|nr:hypothetical protein [Clostridiales bacterium]
MMTDIRNKRDQDKKDQNKKIQNQKNVRQRVYISLMLTLIALVAVTAATVAWFSIADRTKVNTMGLDIVADVEMRMDLDAHDTLDQYVRTLSFESIQNRIQREKGFSMSATPLSPVTTSDYSTFTYENGKVAEATEGSYLEFTLHFMAAKDMIVHLTSADSDTGKGDGTMVSSGVAALPQAMRISFTADGQTWVYDPGAGDFLSSSGAVKVFGLAPAADMKVGDNNALFTLKEGEDKPVVVHIWIEGTDPQCTDELKKADYSIRLRFTGTDMNGKSFTE